MFISKMQTLLCFAIIFAHYVTSVSCVKCVKRDYCSCVFDDGSGMVDLTTLAKTDGTPVFYDIPSALDSSVFSYNPCHSFHEGMCSDVAICRFNYLDFTYSDLGVVESTDFSYDGANVFIHYASKDGSRFYDIPSALDSSVFSYNPCHSFHEGMCSDVAICRFNYLDFTYSDLGVVESTDFSYDGANVFIHYASKDGSRSADVRLVCDKLRTSPVMEVYGEDSPLHYSMTVTSAKVCLKAAPPGYFTSGLSAGSVLLIIFSVLLVVYLVGGVLFSKYKRGATGKEVIPNLNIWLALPGLIREGFLFTVNKTCRRKRQTYNSI